MMECMTTTSVNQEHKVLQHNISGITSSTLINDLNVNPVPPAKTAFGTPLQMLLWGYKQPTL